MKITLHTITIGDLTRGYNDMDEEGVVAYGGRLNVRPKYQRNFVYDDKKRNAVIESVRRGFPINVMYWAVNADGSLEMLDGQQRTISICEYVGKKYSINAAYFHTLTQSEQEQILDYPLQVYFCAGTDREKLDWFQTINIASETLTAQELRNAVYVGEWLTDAKRKFSRRLCVAARLNDGLVSGDPNRQALLEKVLKWAAEKDGLPSIEDYMANHQNDPNANREWQYFQDIIAWAKKLFPFRDSNLCGQPWGEYYNAYHDCYFDPDDLRARYDTLMEDDEVVRKSGIVPYLFSGEERHLNLRAFTKSQKQTMYARQNGLCPICHEHYELSQMEGDHITPWSEGGKTELDNGQMLCRDCNRRKGAR